MDQAALLREAFPSYGPAWEAAIDYGIDVSLLTDHLELTPMRRLQRLEGAMGLVGAFRPERGIFRLKLINRLLAHNVEFVVAGGVAAWIHGVAMIPADLDVVAPLTVENRRRLLAALKGLDPLIAETPELDQPLTLLTDAGKLDVLSTVPPVGSFEDVAHRAEAMTMLDTQVRVIALDDLIAVKAEMARPKDRHVELELRAIRELRAARK